MQGSDPETEPLMLVALQKVPHLAHVCAESQVLKELRSICSKARAYSTGLITGLSVDFEHFISDSQWFEVAVLLSTSKLRRINVVLHLERHVNMASSLIALADCLREPLSSVTHLNIHLNGEDTCTVDNPLIVAAAAAVRILSPVCSPLTHITVSGEVRTWGETTYTLLLQAASAVCAETLTHFSFNMQARLVKSQMKQGQEDQVLTSGCNFLLDDTASDALSSLTSLTHLKLEHGSVCDQEAWAALPITLQCLDICSQYINLPDNLILPNLRKLCMKQCDCYDLLDLLKACPLLQQLALVRLHSPTGPAEQQDLEEVMTHSLWCAKNGGGIHCTPVTESHQGVAGETQSPLAPWDMLVALPVMPTITNFRINFLDSQAGQHLFVNPVRLLHHIPRLCPRLQILCIEHVLQLDLDLVELHVCSSLRILELHDSDDVSGEEVLMVLKAL